MNTSKRVTGRSAIELTVDVPAVATVDIGEAA